MPEPTCTAPDCGRPTPDAFLCARHTDDLGRLLTHLPAELTDLAITLTRQANTSRAGGGKPTKASESPLPFDLHSAELADRARNGLSTWIRHLCEARGVQPPMLAMHGTAALAIWLHRHIESIRQDEWAGQLLTELKALRAELRAAVDNRETKFAGQCTATLAVGQLVVEVVGDRIVPDVTIETERTCEHPLRMRPNAATVTCRACGAEYPALEIHRRILVSAQEYMATGPFIAHALTDLGYPINTKQLQRMDAKGALFAWRENDLGEPMYRIGDVLDLLPDFRMKVAS